MPFHHFYPFRRSKGNRYSVKKSMHNTTNSTMFMDNVQHALINEKNFNRCETNNQATDCDRIKDSIQYTLRRLEDRFKQDPYQKDDVQKDNFQKNRNSENPENFEVSLTSGPDRITYYSNSNYLESCKDGFCQKIYFTR